ncbi:MAG TPA: hypothetical protein VFP84_38515 [Kofleriaceae bacterium]|nr:hypothetical protein [Kofleriaceae bacterium]
MIRAALVLIALGAPIAARADRTDQCIAESETGQRLLLTRHFVEARAHLVACGRVECPAAVTRDCIERLHQAEASVASVVVGAQRAGGGDVRDARVFIDDDPTPHACTGEALWLDPGRHRFRVQAPDGTTVTRELGVAEGARLTQVIATFESPAAEAAPVEATRPRRTWAVITGAVGVGALAAGAAFGLVARSRQADERDACASTTDCRDPGAAQRAFHSAQRFGNASTAAVVAGGVLVAAGAVLWLTAPTSGPRTALAPAFAPHQAGLAVLRAF